VIVEKKKQHANVKEVINPVKLYLLVETVDGAGKELSVAENAVREDRPLRRGKASVTGFSSHQVSAGAWRDFMPAPSSSQGPLSPPPWGPPVSLWVSYRLLMPCMPQAEHLHLRFAFLPVTSVSVPSF